MANYVSKILLDRGGVHTSDRGAALTVNQEGLIGFYPMEENSETILLDESKNKNTGRIHGPTHTTGRAGQALRFDEDAHVEIPSMAVDFDSDNFTYCLFAVKNKEGKILHKRDDKIGYEARFEDDRIKAVFQDGHTGTELISDTRISTDEFYFIAVVRKNRWVKLYVNAAMEHEQEAEYDLRNKGSLRLGDIAEQGFDGILDEVYVYDRGLDDWEIQNIYEKYIGPP
jgi:hypothetical protein